MLSAVFLSGQKRSQFNLAFVEQLIGEIVDNYCICAINPNLYFKGSL